MAYPQTAQDMVDRLLADRQWEVRMVVTDNYPAVRANFEAQLQSGQSALIDTPEKLIDQLLWWDQYQGGRDTVDPVLSVPYRATTGSAVLTSAVEQLAEMSSQSEGHPLGLTDGITAYVGALKNTPVESSAASAVQAAEAAAKAAADAAKAAMKARTTRVVAIIILLVAIGAAIWYLKTRK
jgi:hypothetical protein